MLKPFRLEVQIYSCHSLTKVTSRHQTFRSTQRCRLWICTKFPAQWYLNIFVRRYSSHWLFTVPLFSLGPSIRTQGDLNEVCCVEIALRREGASSTHHTLQKQRIQPSRWRISSTPPSFIFFGCSILLQELSKICVKSWHKYYVRKNDLCRPKSSDR